MHILDAITATEMNDRSWNMSIPEELDELIEYDLGSISFHDVARQAIPFDPYEEWATMDYATQDPYDMIELSAESRDSKELVLLGELGYT